MPLLALIYIVYATDADNKISESNEDNNTIAKEITIQNGIADYIPLDFKIDGKTSLEVECGQFTISTVTVQKYR